MGDLLIDNEVCELVSYFKYPVFILKTWSRDKK